MPTDPELEKTFAVVRCKDCNCPIVWARNVETGAMLPLDARTVVYEVRPTLEGGEAHAYKIPKLAPSGFGYMISHLDSCKGRTL